MEEAAIGAQLHVRESPCPRGVLVPRGAVITFCKG